MIKTRCYTDDHIVETEFDATPWFQAASDVALLELGQCGWGGDYPADAVAEESAHLNPDLQFLFEYIARLSGTRRSCGFECHVDEEQALAWLQEHRPHLLPPTEWDDPYTWYTAYLTILERTKQPA